MTYFGKESENENHQMWASFTTALNEWLDKARSG